LYGGPDARTRNTDDLGRLSISGKERTPRKFSSIVRRGGRGPTIHRGLFTRDDVETKVFSRKKRKKGKKLIKYSQGKKEKRNQETSSIFRKRKSFDSTETNRQIGNEHEGPYIFCFYKNRGRNPVSAFRGGGEGGKKTSNGNLLRVDEQ